MKQKLLSVAVATALGLGVIGQAQAQGVKAYGTAKVVDIRLVNPNGVAPPGNLVNVVPDAVVAGTGSTDATASVEGAVQGATGGNWNTTPGFPPEPPNLPQDAAQSCIDGDGNDFIPDFPLIQAGGLDSPCPFDPVFEVLGNDFNQVDEFQDFGRSDTQLVGGTDFAQGQPDVDIDGDDFEFVAACQRSGNSEPKNATSDTSSFLQAVDIFLDSASHNDTPILQWRGTYTGRVEAITSGVGPASSTGIDLGVEFSIERLADGATTQCTDITLRKAALGSDDIQTDQVPDGFTVECNAANFSNPPFVFQASSPDARIDYRIINSASADANCTLAPVEGGDGFKWYFAKNDRSPRLPRPIVSDLVVNDQFGTQTVDVRQLTGLMNPANKNEAGLPDFTDHLSCYLLGRTSPVPVIPGEVRITTLNFGEEDVALRRGPVLCGPAIKTDEDGNSQGNLAGTYYQCYLATGGQPQGAITVSDQFFDEKPHALTGMSRVCAPVTFGAGTPPPDPEAFDHLACYEFPGSSQALNPWIEVEVLDPFMVGAGFGAPGVPVAVEREERFCEIATKVRLPLP